MKKDLVKGTSIKVSEQSDRGRVLPLFKFIISLAHEVRSFVSDCLKCRKWKFIYWRRKDKDSSEVRIEVNVNE